jgi:hypothetical protein
MKISAKRFDYFCLLLPILVPALLVATTLALKTFIDVRPSFLFGLSLYLGFGMAVIFPAYLVVMGSLVLWTYRKPSSVRLVALILSPLIIALASWPLLYMTGELLELLGIERNFYQKATDDGPQRFYTKIAWLIPAFGYGYVAFTLALRWLLYKRQIMTPKTNET